MKCDECLPILEEYFDGELDQHLNETISAHLAACAECVCAFNALGDEQEMYALYQRDVEVTPALWQSVRARIEEQPDAPPHASLLTRLRERFAAAPALPIFTPALAGSLALVAVCVTAGVMWYGRTPEQTLRTEVAQADKRNDARAPVAGETLNAAPDVDVTDVHKLEGEHDGAVVALVNKGAAISTSARVAAVSEIKGVGIERNRPVTFVAAKLRRDSRRVAFSNEHPVTGEDALLLEEKPVVFVKASELANAPLATPDDVEISRHIEKAQLLLRSFRNANYAEEPAASTDVAYEKRLSRELLNENIMLRRDAETEGNVPTERLLSALEPFLLDISNLHDNPSKQDVRSIQARIGKKEIIAALQVY
jgi:anti-sigma factor RsiW